MSKASCFLAILTFAALPAFAQSTDSAQQFGLLFGGSKRIADAPGPDQGAPGINDFKFSNSVKEAFYAVSLDTGSYFKIKVGQISGPVAFRADNGSRVDVAKGDVNHIDALVDYKFSEPFGSTGLFAGVGMYRLDAAGQSNETNIGFSGGVNGDFPLTRRYGVMVEAAYHWLRTDVRQRYVTLTGGLRINF